MACQGMKIILNLILLFIWFPGFPGIPGITSLKFPFPSLPVAICEFPFPSRKTGMWFSISLPVPGSQKAFPAHPWLDEFWFRNTREKVKSSFQNRKLCKNLFSNIHRPQKQKLTMSLFNDFHSAWLYTGFKSCFSFHENTLIQKQSQVCAMLRKPLRRNMVYGVAKDPTYAIFLKSWEL